MKGDRMTVIVYLVGGIVATGLFAYLMLALLKPEWFA
jgi:K+-transporting ATPase KdpF subunit